MQARVFTLALVLQSIKQHFTEEQLKELINFSLHYFADLDIPVKRYGSDTLLPVAARGIVLILYARAAARLLNFARV